MLSYLLCLAVPIHILMLIKSTHFLQLQLLIELDGAEQRQGVFVIGATNR